MGHRDDVGAIPLLGLRMFTELLEGELEVPSREVKCLGQRRDSFPPMLCLSDVDKLVGGRLSETEVGVHVRRAGGESAQRRELKVRNAWSTGFPIRLIHCAPMRQQQSGTEDHGRG